MKWFGYGDMKIGEKEILITVPSMLISGGILTLPNQVAEVTTGSDGWIVIFLGGVVILCMAWLTARMAAVFPGQTFLTYASSIITKPIAILITFIFSINFLLITSYVIRSVANTAKEYMFDRTPTEVLSLSFLLVAIYAVGGSRIGIIRLNMMFFPIMFVVGVSILLFNIREFHFDNLFPMFKSDLSQYVKGFKAGLTPYVGIGILFFYMAYVEKPRKAPKMAVLGVCITIVFYLMVFITVIGVFGHEATANLLTPTVELSKRAEIPGGMFERLELIFFVIWMMMVFNTAAMAFDIAILAIQSVFNKMAKIKIILFFSPLAYLISMLPQNYAQVQAFGAFITLSGISLTAVSAIVLFMVAKIRGVKAND